MAFVKNIYENELIAKMKANTFVGTAINGEFVKEAIKGTSVTLNRIAGGSLQTGTPTWQGADVDQQVINIASKGAYMVKIDSIDQWNSDGALQAQYSDDMVKKYKEKIDTDAFAAWKTSAMTSNQGVEIDVVLSGLTKDTVLTNFIAPIVRQFDEFNTPAENRMVVVTPYINSLLMLSGLFNKEEGIEGVGYQGTAMGVKVFMSTLLPTDGASTGADKICLAFDKDMVASYVSLAEFDVVKLIEGFGTGVKGLVYGGADGIKYRDNEIGGTDTDKVYIMAIGNVTP